jgi:hypothetical protein
MVRFVGKVRNCILLGHHPMAIHNGVEGFAEGNIRWG